MYKYDRVQNNHRLLRAMTSVNRPEFAKMLPMFQRAWESQIQEKSLEPGRQRRLGGGRKPVLQTTTDKLWFILFYFKTYPLQQVIAFSFGMSQGQACYWIHTLSPVLKEALNCLEQLPERRPTQLAAHLAKSGETRFGIDGTDRKIRRPKKPGVQEKYYSGKKKTHIVKNDLIAAVESRKVKYLSKTYAGKIHDKKICDKERPRFPNRSILYQDTGFQGYRPRGVIILQPKKKPRGGELSAEDKERNRSISKVRVFMEHVIAGVKRCHIVKDVLRTTKDGFDDLVMEICCGLHNFRTECRSLFKSPGTYFQ